MAKNAVFSRARKCALCYFIMLIMLSTWIYRSLSYYARRHLILVLTAMLASAILSAALLTGASLHAQLRQNLRARLGSIQRAQFFSSATVARPALTQTQNAALYCTGELLDAQGICCANTLQIIGLPNLPLPDSAPSDSVLANARAAALLPQTTGFIRLRKPNALSIELPLGNARSDTLVRRTITLAGTATAAMDLIPPDFAFMPSTLPSPTIFMPLQRLHEALGLASNQVNLLLAADTTPFPALTNLADYGLHVQPAPQTNTTFVSSSRIFLPRHLETRLHQQGLPTEAATFHLVDDFTAQTNTTPYGFVAALAPEQLQTRFGLTLNAQEIIISDWLSQQLQITTNQALTLTWRRFEADGTLLPDTRTFTVRAIVSIAHAAQTTALMPTFPGMKDVDSCAHWDIGLPMDETKLNDPANEAYWKAWRETPKAFIAWQAGTNLFGTHFGTAMTLQVKAPPDRVTQTLLKLLTTADAGGQTLDLAKTGEQAAQGSTDFNGLFAGMAFILMVSALILLSLSLARVLDARKPEIATLRAVGWSSQKIRRALLAEWILPFTVAALAGATAGSLLAYGLVFSLNRFWSSAFAGGQIDFYFSRGPLLLAAIIGWALTFSVLFFKAGTWSRTTPAALWQTAPGDLSMTMPTRQRLRILHLAGSLCAAISLTGIPSSVCSFTSRRRKPNG
ncbi:MAG: ABC transporter permease [Clostridia bacterium]|nr:ABC transporter permease [Clostridia bacterium]